jgi:hypothetical protein
MQSAELRLADLKDYTTFTSDIDLTASSESAAAGPKGAVWLYVADAGTGTLAIELAVAPSGTRVTRTLTVATGRQLIIDGVTKILAATDLGRLTVGWQG